MAFVSRALTQTCSTGGQLEAGRALAAETAGDVVADGVALTQIVPAVTLINILGKKTKSTWYNQS